MTMRKEKYKSKNPVIEIRYDDQVLLLQNCFISGRLVEEDGDVGFYGGQVDIGEMGVSLMNLLRAVLKTTSEECGLTLEKSTEFIKHCLVEAVNREILEAEKRTMDEISQYLKDIANRFKESQN